MNSEFVSFGKFARDAIKIFMQYSYSMNNRKSIVGGGGIIVVIFVM